jgi:hypothetical protein
LKTLFHLCRCALLASALCAVAPWAPAADADASLTVQHWVATRVRKTVDASNVVRGEFQLTNASSAEISDIAILIRYLTADGQELKATEPTLIPKLAPHETREVVVQTGWTPNFECYEIHASYRDALGERKVRWVGRGEQGQPTLVPGAPRDSDPRVMILGDVFWRDKPEMPLQGLLRILNTSRTSLQKLTAKITFDDGGAPPKLLGHWSGQLGDGRLGAGEERTFKFDVPTAPKSYGKYLIELTYAAADAPSELARWNGGEFTGNGDIEAAHWNFRRLESDEAVAVSVRVRNNSSAAVDAATMRLTFTKGQGGQKRVVREVAIQLTESLPAGATREVEFTLRHFTMAFDELQRTALPSSKPTLP